MSVRAWRATLGVLLAATAACGGRSAAVDARRSDGCSCDAAQGEPEGQCTPFLGAGLQGCGPGEKCAWIRLADPPATAGRIACVPDGPAQVGEACTRSAVGLGTGYDDCIVGATCIGDGVAAICLPICDPTASPTACAAGETCAQYPGLGGDGTAWPPMGACTAP